MQSVANSQSQLRKGFTLIELIVVIIILGILSITVVPKCFSSNGFEQYTYRNETITTLRALQLRSMQQTDGDFCQQISVTSTHIGLQKTDTNKPNNCDVSTLADSGKESVYSHTSVSVAPNHAVSFSVSGLANVFAFDQMGRLVNSSGNRINCSNTQSCRIVVTGENAFTIKIEHEGYIHAL